MTLRRRNLDAGNAAVALCLLIFTLTAAAGAPTNVVLHLKNGDRLAGTLIAEETNRVVLATSWVDSLPVPRHVIDRIEFPAPAGTVVAAATNPPPATATTNAVAAAATPQPPVPAKSPATNVVAKPATAKPPPAASAAAKPKPKKFWKTNLTVGMDLQSGAKDRSLYFGTVKLTYEQPYKSNPKKYFRNIVDYRADYGETDGQKSVNRMNGSVKTDFDLRDNFYVYSLVAAGYDESRKIELGYEVGPGIGYHLFRKPKFVLDVEGGLNFQYQDRSGSEDTESLYLRFAENVTWKIAQRITFTEKLEFYPSLEDIEDFRARFESTISFGIVQNLSFNFSVVDIYDTKPARNVDRNELLVRSSLGLTF